MVSSACAASVAQASEAWLRVPLLPLPALNSAQSALTDRGFTQLGALAAAAHFASTYIAAVKHAPQAFAAEGLSSPEAGFRSQLAPVADPLLSQLSSMLVLQLQQQPLEARSFSSIGDTGGISQPLAPAAAGASAAVAEALDGCASLAAACNDAAAGLLPSVAVDSISTAVGA